MITLTESAKDKIIDLLAEEQNPNMNLRIFVQGGGCTGFQYGFMLDEQVQDDDHRIEVGTWSVLVDAASVQYLIGAVIDYKSELFNSGFKIENPNVTATCGCGSSFSV